MLPLQVVINNIAPEPGLAIPLLTVLSVIAVALIGAWSLKASDERKRAQEDRRRWDVELVNEVVDLLVITDDVAQTEDELEQKKKDIIAGTFPSDLNRQMTKIRLLTNEAIGDKCQETVATFMRYRLMIKLLDLDAELQGVKIDWDDLPDDINIESNTYEPYWEARNIFADAIHELVVADSVRIAGKPKDTDWKALMRKANDSEGDLFSPVGRSGLRGVIR